MFFRSMRFPAATRTKLQGTGSVCTMAPEDNSLWPVIENFFSCMAVSSSCCDFGESVAISSMNSTPRCARCIMPAMTRRCGGVPNPPDWSGSCLTSPSNAPAFAPVASMNGACFWPALSTTTLGTMFSPLGFICMPTTTPRPSMPATMRDAPAINSLIQPSQSSTQGTAMRKRNATNPTICLEFPPSIDFMVSVVTILSPFPALTSFTFGLFWSVRLG